MSPNRTAAHTYYMRRDICTSFVGVQMNIANAHVFLDMRLSSVSAMVHSMWTFRVPNAAFCYITACTTVIVLVETFTRPHLQHLSL